jgi:hypothetical protein
MLSKNQTFSQKIFNRYLVSMVIPRQNKPGPVNPKTAKASHSRLSLPIGWRVDICQHKVYTTTNKRFKFFF